MFIFATQYKHIFMFNYDKGGENMTEKIARFIMAFLGAIVGFVVANSLTEIFKLNQHPMITQIIVYVFGILLFAIIFYLLFNPFFKFFTAVTGRAVEALQEFALMDIIHGTIGLIVGFLLAFLISQPLYRISIPYIGNLLIPLISIVIYLALGFLGLKVATRDKEEWSTAFSKLKISSKERSGKKEKQGVKILDTSVIIDGRIIDIFDAGFMEGHIIIPIFVLEELQHIADSENSLRRQKGRRGLDVLNSIQENYSDRVEVTVERYPEIEEVDSKILRMAKEMSAKVVTNDYNLNKVASVQNIEVLNINELANAMKPVVIPGEEMSVRIIKDGNQSDQGLGYLDDGTMIVVEGGKRYIGQQVNTLVTSVIQTAAGKMIFVKMKDSLPY